MASKKLRDVAVKTGEYTDGQGNTKGRWQNVGSLMRSDDGNEFIILHRWFNPAGVPNPDDRDSVLLSCFKPDQQNQQQQPPQQNAYQQARQGNPPQGYAPPPSGYDGFDDSIP